MGKGTRNYLNFKRFNNYDIDKDYTKYKVRHIPKSQRLQNRQEVMDFSTEFFKTISENITKQKAGVLVKGLGYFFIWQVPRKLKYRDYSKENSQYEYNFHTNHKMYMPVFEPDVSSGLKFWSMDKAFHSSVKKDLCKRLKAGEKFKMYANSFRKYLKRNDG